MNTNHATSTPRTDSMRVKCNRLDNLDAYCEMMTHADDLERELNDTKFRVKSALETLDSMLCECAENPMGACDRCHAISILKPI